VDHSAFDAQAFLIEADGKRALYSGDMRLHGRKPGMADVLTKAVSGKGVDVLLMEGTHFSPDREAGLPEEQLEQTVLADIQSASGLVLASFSPMHIDRLVTFYKGTRRAGRVLLLDHYGAYVLFLAATMAKVPKPEAASGIRVFLPQRRKIIAKVERRFAHNRIEMDDILADPRRYVMLFRPSMIATDFKGVLPERVRCLYSYWSGYLKKPEWQQMQAKVAEAGGDFIERHTSGHIYATDIVKFVQGVNPRRVVPIHTTQSGEFRKHFSNVLHLKDGENWEVAR
jgi:ribonuclease J